MTLLQMSNQLLKSLAMLPMPVLNGASLLTVLHTKSTTVLRRQKLLKSFSLKYLSIQRKIRACQFKIAERFSRFSRDAMAKGVLDEIGKETFTMGKIRKALDKMFTEPPNALVRLVRSTIEDDTIKPAQVKKALSRLWARTSEVEITPISTLSVFPTTTETMKPKGRESIDKRAQPQGSIEEVDTIVVSALEDGFQEVFIGENRWYAIRMHASMIPRIKYIAAYRVAPISAVTHWALVNNIVPWQDTGKFVVNFAEPAKEVNHINLVPKSRVKAPQGPRYAFFDKLQQARTLDELF